jgi:para-aminobenzoate synthetase component 1
MQIETTGSPLGQKPGVGDQQLAGERFVVWRLAQCAVGPDEKARRDHSAYAITVLRRILTRRLDAWADPDRVFTALYASEAHAFWLDAGPGADTGMSYLGAGTPLARASSLPELITGLRSGRGALSEVAESPTGFGLGWVGWIGYEFGAVEQQVPVESSTLPGAVMLWVPRCVAFDHEHGLVTLLALEGTPDADAWLDETARLLDALAREQAATDRGAEPPAPFPLSGTPASDSGQDGAPAVALWRHSPERYTQLVIECQKAIRRGDAYQLCLTNEITARVHPDPLRAYLALRSSSPSHHGGYLRSGTVALLSASPERFLSVDSRGLLETKPIKGTRPRGDTPETDRALADELLGSDKERAENLMIVDLMRNDLSRVAALGSVEVTTLLDVESYSAVHQLVSTVRARLRDGLDSLDALSALFPAGSMTGAPKISAMRILNRLEAGPRGIYAGVFGYMGLDGSLDLAMVIRSIVLTPAGASIGTGGGITALSSPAEEVEETLLKAGPLRAVLGV